MGQLNFYSQLNFVNFKGIHASNLIYDTEQYENNNQTIVVNDSLGTIYYLLIYKH